MKRFLGILLTVMLLCGQLLSPAALATADEIETEFTEETVSEVKASADAVDAAATDSISGADVNTDPDEDVEEFANGSAGAAGLVIDEGSDTVDDVAPVPEEPEETVDPSEPLAPAVGTTDYDYGRIAEGGADVFAQADAEAPSARLGGGAVVLLTGERGGQRAEVVFDTDDGVVTAWVNADSCKTLNDGEKQEYLAGAPASARAYEKEPNALLVKVACTVLQPEIPETEEPQNPENTEETQDPEKTENTENTEEAKDPEKTEKTENTEETKDPENTENTEETQDPEKTENTEETQDPEKTENTEETQDPEKTENTEEIKDPEKTENTEEIKDPENTENTEETQDPEKTENTEEIKDPEKTEDTEETKDPEKAEETKDPEKTEETENTEDTRKADDPEKAADDEEAEDDAETEEAGEATEGASAQSNAAAASLIPSFAEAQMIIGATRTVVVRDVTGAPLSGSGLTFTSSDANIVSVNAAGTVYARRAGTVVITASYTPETVPNDANDANEGSSVQSCEVKIQVLGLPGWVGSSIGKKRTIGIGEYYTGLHATFPAGTGAAVVYTSSKPKIAAVDRNTGAIYGKKKGKTVITITTSNGKKAKCTVTVMKSATKVSLNAGSLMLARDGRTAQLWAGVPKKTTGGVLKWTSSNPSVATVNAGGRVTSVNPGTAVITVQTLNGVGGKSRSASCRVTVTEPPAQGKAQFNSTSCNIWLGGTAYPGITALDAAGNIAAPHPTLRIVSAVPAGCVAISGTGIRGVRTGTAVVAFTTYNGVDSLNTVTVQVFAKVKKVKLYGTKTLTAGQQYCGWNVAVSPAGAYKGVTFSSSKPSVLRVLDASTGLVQAMKKGTATITVRTHNGKKAKIKVKVKKAPPAPRYIPTGTASELVEYMIGKAQGKLGCKYVYGAGYTYKPEQNIFDCSGFTYWCYQQIGVTLKNSAGKQGADNTYGKVAKGDLKRGDVVCFHGDGRDFNTITHTGIYLGNGYFIHASSSAGKVIISEFVSKSSNYYDRCFSWGRRVRT